MAITRYDPMRELGRLHDPFRELSSRLQDEFGRIFKQLMPEEEFGSAYYPPVDIYEDNESVFLTAELPGVEMRNLELLIENNVMTLKGERKLERDEKKENYRRIERLYGTFARSFTLPATVDSAGAKAELKNGLLRVVLPKKEESKPKAIRVQVH